MPNGGELSNSFLDFNTAAPQHSTEQGARPGGTEFYDQDELSQKLADCARGWVTELYPNGRYGDTKDEWRCGDPSGRAPSKRGSYKINLAGDNPGSFFNFDNNDKGGPIATVKNATGLSGRDLILECVRLVETYGRGISGDKPKSNGHTKDFSNEVNHIISQSTTELTGTLAERYFTETRKCTRLPSSPFIRFYDNCTHWKTKRGMPAIIAICIDPVTNEPTGGIERLYLGEDADGRVVVTEKKMLGKCPGVFPIDKLSDRHGVGEGIATALAGGCIYGVSAWAAGSDGGMLRLAKAIEVDPGGFRQAVSELFAFADRGEAGEAAALRLAGAAAAAGVVAYICRPSGDDDLSAEMMAGRPPLPPERIEASAPAPAETLAPPGGLTYAAIIERIEALPKPSTPEQDNEILSIIVASNLDDIAEPKVISAFIKKTGTARRAVDKKIKQLRAGALLNDKTKIIIQLGAPYDTAKKFVERFYTKDGKRAFQRYKGDFYRYNGAAYDEISQEGLRSDLYDFLDKCWTVDGEGKLQQVKPDVKMVSSLFDALRGAVFLDDELEAPAWIDATNDVPASEVISCKNVLLHMKSLRTHPHTPDFFTHNALEFSYDPNAPKPKHWLKFLDDLWGADAQSIETLQEWFGYNLSTDTDMQKIMLLVGAPRSGKGTIGRILICLIGKKNYAAPTLADFCENFGLEPLVNKRSAIISDARISAKSDPEKIAERLLSISGEDAIQVNRKNKSHWRGQLKTRLTFLSNYILRLSDASGALAGRFITLELTNSFAGREDLGLFNRLAGELPSILNWSIEGYRRLRQRGHFVQPESGMELQEQFEDFASAIKSFVSDRCELSELYESEIDDVWRQWLLWCKSEGRLSPGNKSIFSRDLRSAFPGQVTRIRPRKGESNKRPRKFKGIRISVYGQAEAEHQAAGEWTGLNGAREQRE